MTTLRVQCKGCTELITALHDFTGKELLPLLRKATKKAMEPTLSLAKHLAPKVTGRLATSLKLQVLKKFDARFSRAGSMIYPANDFTYIDSASSTMRGVARSAKKRAGFAAKGIALDNKSVWLYAHIVETGETRKGKHRMAPRHYLQKAIEQRYEAMLEEFGAQVYMGIAKIRAR